MGKIGPQAGNLLAGVLLVKYAGPSVFGQYTVALAVFNLIFGTISAALIIDYQRNGKKEFFELYTKHQFSFLLLFFSVTWITLVYLDLSGFSILAIGIAVFGLKFSDLLSAKFRFNNKDIYSILPRTLPIFAFCILLFLIKPESIEYISAVFFACWVVLSIASARPRAINLNGIRSALRKSNDLKPLWLSLLCTQAFGGIDLVLIGRLGSDESVAIFKIGYTFASFLMPIVSVLNFMFLTKISTYKIPIGKKLKFDISLQTLFLCLIGFSGIIFSFLIFPQFSNQLYGEIGGAAVEIVKILSFALFFNMVGTVFSYILIFLKKDKMVFVINMAGALIYLLLTILSIRYFGLVEVAYSMLIAHSVIMFFMLFVALRFLRDSWEI